MNDREERLDNLLRESAATVRKKLDGVVELHRERILTEAVAGRMPLKERRQWWRLVFLPALATAIGAVLIVLAQRTEDRQEEIQEARISINDVSDTWQNQYDVQYFPEDPLTFTDLASANEIDEAMSEEYFSIDGEDLPLDFTTSDTLEGEYDEEEYSIDNV